MSQAEIVNPGLLTNSRSEVPDDLFDVHKLEHKDHPERFKLPVRRMQVAKRGQLAAFQDLAFCERHTKGNVGALLPLAKVSNPGSKQPSERALAESCDQDFW